MLRTVAVIVVLSSVVHVAGTVSAAERAPRRLNVLFLLADDQRPDGMHALGNPTLKTPHLDRLVAQSMVLPNAYCLGSNSPAVCTPSRNMLLSGRAYFRWSGRLASGDDPNFPDTMKAAGYETYHHGKKSNTATEIQKKFDHDKYVNDNYDRTNGEPCRDIVNAAVEFLDQRSDEKPFFMYLAFSNPHDPRVAHDKYRALYQTDEIPLPKNDLPQHPFDNGEMAVRDEQLAPWPRTEHEIRSQLHDYYAVISAMDHHIGRLLAHLDERKLADDTIIIYSSDHGLALGSHGLMGKQNLYEHSMRSPLLFRGPGIKPGRSEAMVYLLDIFPTVCDLVGASTPAGLDGRSFADVLRGTASAARDSIALFYRDVQRAVRDERWKLIRYPQVGVTQLFDLANDRDELKNLAGDPNHAARIDILLAKLASEQRRYGDTCPLRVESPKDPAWSPPPVQKTTTEKGAAAPKTFPPLAISKTVQVAGLDIATAAPPKGLVLRPVLGLVTVDALAGNVVHRTESRVLEARTTITPGGDYLLMFPEGDHYAKSKGEKLNTMIAYRSSDRGRTWQGPTVAFDIPYSQHGFIPFIPRGSKRLYAFGTQPLPGKWTWLDGQRENAPIGYRTSDDDGRTWSDVTLIEPTNDPQFRGMSVMRMTETDAGTWLVGSHLANWDAKPLTTAQYLLRSTDQGKTWQVLPGARPHGWVAEGLGRMDEGRPLNLGGGRVLFMTRTPQGHLFTAHSADDGQTWTTPAPSTLVHPDAPPMLFPLSDGKTLAAFHHNRVPRRGNGDLDERSENMRVRSEIWVATSTDGGYTWSAPRFVLANAAEPTLKSGAWNYQCSYLDGFTDHGVLHLIMPHRWQQVLHLTIAESDLATLPTQAELAAMKAAP
ncbi:MAG TPA: sulfatase-like hydrolase/transferase [Pirellulales bacterium]|nr:sulfatase-like hydrolase/transferase [Pirellulales bacterium]